MIVGEEHVVKHGPQGLAIHPQQPLGLGQPRFHRELGTMQGDTAIAIGRAGKEGMRELAFQLVGCLQPASGLA